MVQLSTNMWLVYKEVNLTKPQYLLDTNIFIEASRRYYHFDICLDFWSMLIEQHKNERVFSIKPVKDEIGHKKQKNANLPDDSSKYDKLSLWVRDECPKSLFVDCNDSLVSESYKKIIQSVHNNPQYFAEAKEEFDTVADSWVIAYAHAHSLTVVTHENNTPGSKKRVLMPVVCKEFNVPVATLFEMLLALKIKFIRKPEQE